MKDGISEKNGKSLLVKEHWYTYTTKRSSEVISDGFKGLARELREVADQIEAIVPKTKQQT